MAVNDFGMVRPGTTLIVPFHTFDSNDPSASVTITGLAVTDIEVYKDGSNTTRASDSGYALLGTNGIDEFGTGVHGFSIDLADNSTANFYEAGSRYHVVVASITVDAATVNFVAATFEIGYPGAVVNTTIATLASQISFTLEDASAEAGAYIGCPVIVHDLASAVQIAFGYISAYAVTTKTVTLAADPGIFTMAAGDSISIFPPAQVASWGNVPLATTDPMDAILADVTGLNGDAMRGTDSAALASVCTEGRLAELDAGNLPTDISSLNDISVADVLTTAMTESYNADGAAPTLAQALFLLISYLMEANVSGTTVSAKKIDGSTEAATFTLNDATSPTGVTRAS